MAQRILDSCLHVDAADLSGQDIAGNEGSPWRSWNEFHALASTGLS